MFLNVAGKEPTYDVDCNTIIGLEEDSCKGESSARILSTPEGLLGYFNDLKLSEPEEWAAESKSALCTINNGEGLLESEDAEGKNDTQASGGLITVVGGGTPSVSP